LPLIRSYTREFYFLYLPFHIRTRTPVAPPTLSHGKLGGLPPGPAALLPRTRPSNGIRNGRYGHGSYGNGYGNCYGNGYENGYGNGYGNGNVMLEIRCKLAINIDLHSAIP